MSVQDVSGALVAVLSSDVEPEVIATLRSAAMAHQGKRELKVLLRGKLQEIVMVTGFHVHTKIKESLGELEWMDEVG
jgi:DNA polymerase-3 subunit alpha